MSYLDSIASVRQKNQSTVQIMECGGFKARLMEACRLTGEGSHGLPPGTNINVFPIAALPACPESWVRAAGTYVCPVNAEKGLWFDWTMNDAYNTAIIPSVKGMNPITGQKIEHIGMEQYRDKCPVHNIDFSHDRYCEKCDYKWPPQNYVCYPDTLWWDGFRSPDGSVRQFFFTEDEKRDIASLVIGKENTVPAFGFVFYRTKVQRNIDPPNQFRGLITYQGDIVFGSCVGASDDSSDVVEGSHTCDSIQNKMSYTYDSGKNNMVVAQNANFKKYLRGMDKEVKTSGGIKLPPKEVSIGGGAKINQNLSVDPLALDAWTEKEAALIRLYFVFEPQLKQIVEKGGIKDVSGTDTGYLSGLPLG